MVPAGIGLAALGLALRDATDPITVAELAGLDRTATGNWSETWGDRSDEFRNLVVGTTFLSLGFEGARSLMKGKPGDGATLAVMLGELYTFLLGTSYTTKALVGRKRPYAFNPRMTLEEKYQILGARHLGLRGGYLHVHGVHRLLRTVEVVVPRLGVDAHPGRDDGVFPGQGRQALPLRRDRRRCRGFRRGVPRPSIAQGGPGRTGDRDRGAHSVGLAGPVLNRPPGSCLPETV